MSNVTDRCNFARRSAISSPSGRRGAGYAALRPASVAVAGRAKRSGSVLAQAILQSSALSAPSLALLFALAAVLAPSHALADGGKGGVVSHAPAGGDGGLDSASAAGGIGGNGRTGAFGTGGGGGGAGVTGGKGGNGENFGGGAGIGGAGGTVAGEAGQAGGPSTTANSGGGGGGGGAHGFVGSAGSLPGLPVTGGAGGAGGNALVGHQGFGGGGGAGGFGAVLDGTSGTISVAITGGAGGAGGAEAVTSAGNGGNGGSGGTGLLFTNGGSFTITSAITGAAGGAGGTADGGGTPGLAGAGGAGIVGSGLNLALGSTAAVTGGLSGGGLQANAISFTGGVNELELHSGATVTGNVVAFSTADTLRLGGTVNGTFDLSQLGPAAQYQGFGILAKAGTSTWTLSNAPAAAMAWQVEAGTLDLGGTMQAASGLTLTGGSLTNGTFSSSGNFNLQAGTVSAVLDGSGALIKTGSGTVTLSGVNTYAGGTTVGAGVLNIQNASALGTGAASVSSGAALEVQGDIFGVPNALTLAGSGIANGGALRNISGDNFFNGDITLAGDTRINSDAGDLRLLGRISGSDHTLTFGGSGAGFTFVDGDIATGTGGVTIDGTWGRPTFFSGANTYTGVTTINSGTLVLLEGAAIADTGAVVVNMGGALRVSDSETIGSLAGAGSVVLNYDHTLTVGSDDSSTSFSGDISEYGGAGSLIKIGAGSFTLSGANSYTGGTTVSAGVLNIRNASALGTGAASVSSGAALEVQGGIAAIPNALTLAGLGISNDGALRSVSGNNSIQGAITLAGNTRINSDAGELTLDGGISAPGYSLVFGGAGRTTVNGVIATGAGGLTVDGAGTVTLSDTNSYAGGTTVGAGVLNIRNDSALGAGAVSVASGAALELQDGIAIANALTLNGSGIANGGALRSVSGFNTVSRAITLAGDARINSAADELALNGAISLAGRSLTFGGAGRTTVYGSIDGTGGLVIDGAGGGYTALGGANTYTGPTTVEAGILQLYNGAAMADTAALVVDAAGAVEVFASETIGSLAGAGSARIGNTSTLTVGGNGASTVFLGVISQFGGAGGLTKIGAGSFTLSEASTYTGTTTVSDGTLIVNGSLASSNVTVAAGATLGGRGTIAGAVGIASGGTLSAGSSPGTLTVGSLVLNSGSNTLFELNSPGVVGGTNDHIIVNGTGAAGNLTLAGTLTANVASAGYYRLFDVTGGGTISGSFDTLALSAPSVAGAAGTLYNAPSGVPTQVNLMVVGSGQVMQFWDGGDLVGNGTVDGGAGTWNAANANWTGAPGQADFNVPWLGSVGVFQGTAGTVAVTGTQSFDTLQFNTDGYVLDGGTLRFGVPSGGTVNIAAGVTTTIGSALVDGAGTGLAKVGAGTLVLTGTNTYTGATRIEAGTLQVGNGGASGTLGGGAVFNDGVLSFNRSDVLTVGNAIGGTGTLVQAGPGTLILTGANSYAGTTRIEAGTLQVGNGGTSGTLGGGAVLNDGALSFNRSDVLAVGNSIGGTGTLVQAGSGTLILTGANSYTGTTRIDAGTLQIGNGGSSGTLGSGPIVNNGALVANRSDSLSIAAAISGTGSLRQAGGGTTTLSGASSYTGRTWVDAGTLIVNGSIASSSDLTVAAGAALGGSGTLPSTMIAGTLAPGNSIGTLTVNGDLGFAAGSTYAVDISPAKADRVNVTGTATLGGAGVSATFASGTYVAKQYTILNATGGVSGTFGAKVDTNLPAGFKSSLGYDSRNAYLNLALDFTPPPPPPPETPPEQPPATPPASEPPAVIPPAPTAAPPAPNSGLIGNQRSAADALTGFFERNGGIPAAFGSLTPAGLSQVAGEPATGTQLTSTVVMNQFMGALVDPSPNGRGVQIAPGPSGFAAYSSSSGKGDALPARVMPLTADPDAWRWSVWASGFGGSQFLGADPGAGTAASTNRVYGAAVGADYRLSPLTVLGFALAGGATSFNTYGLGSGSSDLFQAGAFIRHHIGQSYVAAALAYAWQDVTTDRSVTGVDHLQARFDVNTWSGRLEAGHRVETPFAALTPYGAVQVTSVSLPNYAETALAGSSLFALSYAAKDVTSTRSELGLRAERSFALSNATLLLRGELAWVHNFNLETSATASFQALPGASFLVRGAVQDRNALRTAATAEYKLGTGLSLAATFEGEFAQNSRSYGGKGAIRYSW